jgi:hypothetical protein
MGKKILVCGDTCGKFKSLFTKAGKLQKKHGFSALFCVGNFFADTPEGNSELKPYLDGISSVPLPIYFVLGTDKDTSPVDELPEGGQLCPNLHYLGRSGLKHVEGLSVVFMSGAHDPVFFKDSGSSIFRQTKYEPHYVHDDIKVLLAAYAGSKEAQDHGVDLLLTSEWGRGYHSLLPSTLLPKGLSSSPDSTGSPAVKQVCCAVSAQYHFAGKEGVFFQLPPYKSSNTSTEAFTRFIALGKAGNPNKIKDLYACSLEPVASLVVGAKPENITPSPYHIELNKPKLMTASAGKRKDMSADDMARFSGDFGIRGQRPPTHMPGQGQGRQGAHAGGYNRWGLSQNQV